MPKNNSGEGSVLEHLEALRSALWKSVAAVAAALIPALYFSPDFLRWIIKFTCPEDLKLHYFTPFEPLFVQLNLALAAALIFAAPVIFWQIGSFISPGLYQHEKRTLVFYSSFALLLALCGIALGFFFIIPQVMLFSMTFATEGLLPVLGLGSFLKLVIWMLLGFALVFELPVFLLLPVRAGLIRVQTLKNLRYLFVTVIFLIAALLTPPDIISQLALGIPGWLLFELTLFAAARVEKNSVRDEAEKEDDSEDDTSLSGSGKREDDADVKIYRSQVSERSRLASRSGRIRKL